MEGIVYKFLLSAIFSSVHPDNVGFFPNGVFDGNGDRSGVSQQLPQEDLVICFSDMSLSVESHAPRNVGR